MVWSIAGDIMSTWLGISSSTMLYDAFINPCSSIVQHNPVKNITIIANYDQSMQMAFPRVLRASLQTIKPRHALPTIRRYATQQQQGQGKKGSEMPM